MECNFTISKDGFVFFRKNDSLEKGSFFYACKNFPNDNIKIIENSSQRNILIDKEHDLLEINSLILNSTISNLLVKINKNKWISSENNYFINKNRVFLKNDFKLNVGNIILDLTEDKIYEISEDSFCIETKNCFFKFNLCKINIERETVILINPLGNVANRILQLLVAKKIQQNTKNSVIKNISIPEFGFDQKDSSYFHNQACAVGMEDIFYHLDINGISRNIDNGNIDTFILGSFSFNIDSLPSRDFCKNFIKCDESIKGFGDEFILINIRGGEVFHNVHGKYIVLPPEYYKKIIKDTGLKPVFYGQIEDNLYFDILKDNFPDALFISGRDPVYDFNVIRNSKNIAMCISTFSWLACYLSNANKIYMPLGGIFSINQNYNQNLIPLNEKEYKFIMLPWSWSENLFSNEDLFFKKQRAIGLNIELVKRKKITSIRNKLSHKRKKIKINGFDEDFYLSKYEDVAKCIPSIYPSAIHHYMNFGFYEKREICKFDEQFYSTQYPEAAMACSMGDYDSLFEHYQDYGIMNGYLPVRT